MDIYNICLQFEKDSKDEKNKKFVNEVYQAMNVLGTAMMNANENLGARKDYVKDRV